MWRPFEERRTKCRWPDHEWALVGYSCVNTRRGSAIYAISECSKCGRFKTDEMVQEDADA